ncbi:hypothetical protein ACRALDRAFT_209906 [Sodiomyces alcalophilus JCM 7366]|uniref:uncharacterized protein n=1 Tax=Sodiomyces alcalophilus JCM 7366 TaxID=591952 RepID=UPI0039B4E90A
MQERRLAGLVVSLEMTDLQSVGTESIRNIKSCLGGRGQGNVSSQVARVKGCWRARQRHHDDYALACTVSRFLSHGEWRVPRTPTPALTDAKQTGAFNQYKCDPSDLVLSLGFRYLCLPPLTIVTLENRYQVLVLIDLYLRRREIRSMRLSPKMIPHSNNPQVVILALGLYEDNLRHVFGNITRPWGKGFHQVQSTYSEPQDRCLRPTGRASGLFFISSFLFGTFYSILDLLAFKNGKLVSTKRQGQPGTHNAPRAPPIPASSLEITRLPQTHPYRSSPPNFFSLFSISLSSESPPNCRISLDVSPTLFILRASAYSFE